MAGGRTKKSTKKFEKNHLKGTIERRKEFAKIKQRHQQKEKRKARNERNRNTQAEGGDDADSDDVNVIKPTTNDSPYGDMSVDEFFQGGFDIPEGPEIKHTKDSKKNKEVSQKIGKRKRSDQNVEDEASSSENSLEANIVETDSASGSDEEDGFDVHRGQLNALEEQDPEFYKYLKENDAELLDFDENADLAEVDKLSNDEEDETEKKKKHKKRKTDSEEYQTVDFDSPDVSLELVRKWKEALTKQHSLRAARQVVLAFRAAAHMNEDEDTSYKYSISDPNVYHELLVVTLKHIPDVLHHHLPVKESASGKVRISTESKKYRTLTPLLKSHAASVHHLLKNLSDESTLKLTISAFTPLLPYLLQFRKLLRDISRTLVEIWSDSSNTEATRISSFLVIRKLTVLSDPGLKEMALKSVYQGLVQGSRNTTVHTLAGVNLMKNSAAELWGLDPTVGYTTGFSFIRQLAIHLRSSITKPSKESYKLVYNWQFIHSLDFWSRVLSAHCNGLREAENGKESAFRPLIYPTVQVILGTMRLIPTAQYFPLRFQLFHSLLRISLSSGTYIPLAPTMLEVLNSAEMKKPPKPSTLRPLDFTTAIRAPKSYLRTRVYQDGVGEQAGELLAEFFVLWSKNIAFPELTLPVIVMLKRWLKEVSSKATGNKNTKINTAIGVVVQKLEANARWIEERRRKVEFAPNDRAQVDDFLKDVEWEKTPIGAYVVTQRKLKEERTRMLEEARREEEKKRQEEKEEQEKEMTRDTDGMEDEELESEELSEDEDDDEVEKDEDADDTDDEDD